MPLCPQPFLRTCALLPLVTKPLLPEETALPACSLLKWKMLFEQFFHPLHTKEPEPLYFSYLLYYFSNILNSSLLPNPSSFKVHITSLRGSIPLFCCHYPNMPLPHHSVNVFAHSYHPILYHYCEISLRTPFNHAVH